MIWLIYICHWDHKLQVKLLNNKTQRSRARQMRRVTSTGLLSSAVFLLVTLVSDRQWLGSVGVGGRNTRLAERTCQSAWNVTHTYSQTQYSPQQVDRWKMGGGGGCVTVFRGLETHLQNLLLWAVPHKVWSSLFLAGKPQDWNIRLGHWRLQSQQPAYPQVS